MVLPSFEWIIKLAEFAAFEQVLKSVPLSISSNDPKGRNVYRISVQRPWLGEC
jgi:hypothetical protein